MGVSEGSMIDQGDFLTKKDFFDSDGQLSPDHNPGSPDRPKTPELTMDGPNPSEKGDESARGEGSKGYDALDEIPRHDPDPAHADDGYGMTILRMIS